MKRFRSAPLTKEDKAIRRHVWFFFDGDDLDAVITQMSDEQDRRDANLMLGLTDLRLDGAYANVRHQQTWWGQDGYSMGNRYVNWTSDRWSNGSKIRS